jgi:hypothetical protein
VTQPEMDFSEVITPPPPSDFSSAVGEERKQRGMDQAASMNWGLLQRCREACRVAALGRADRTSTADDSSRALIAWGLSADALGNAAGSLFRGGDWEDTGRVQKSKRAVNHARANRVWRLR